MSYKRKTALLDILTLIMDNNCRYCPNDLARRLNLHPQTIARLLPVFEKTGQLLYEDDKGRLGVYII